MFFGPRRKGVGESEISKAVGHLQALEEGQNALRVQVTICRVTQTVMHRGNLVNRPPPGAPPPTLLTPNQAQASPGSLPAAGLSLRNLFGREGGRVKWLFCIFCFLNPV